MHFEENQLFPGLISLSLRSTAHPKSFQPQPVGASIPFYRNFTLAMDRSPGFGSAADNLYRPFKTRFRFGFTSRLNLANDGNSRTHYAKGTQSARPEGHGPSTACRQTVSGSISLPSRGSFRLSLTVLVHYRSSRSI